MSAFNVVKFRLKPGREEEFLAAHRNGRAHWPGLTHGAIIRTGDRSYCLIGEWQNPDALLAAHPNMIATLNSFRETLEPIVDGVGVTDAISGPVVLDLMS